MTAIRKDAIRTAVARPHRGALIALADVPLVEAFLAIDRMDILATHPAGIAVTGHLAAEIGDWEYKVRYRAALRMGQLNEVQITETREVETFVRLGDSCLSPNERSAVTLALHRGYRLALDHNNALAKTLASASARLGDIRLYHPREIVHDLVRSGALDAEDGNRMSALWTE